ncbi:MAG: MFS transporter [Acidobacteria bacterium]|nr:MFS transporter [Acidobacteriota bacterium]MCW5949691.1 MFS transporter [Pyrinomonadaceae bacterium]
MNRPASYRWWILGVATLSLVVSNGLAIGGLPPFYRPMREEFLALGVIDRAAAETFVADGANITFLMSGLFSLVGGWLVTRFRLRPMMVAGCLVLGCGTLLLAFSRSAAEFYMARFLMGASLGFIGVAPCIVLVTQWFNHRRGLALGVLLTGTSIGGAVIPLIAAPLIGNYGWRTALIAVSSLIWIVLLSLIILVVREYALANSDASPDTGLNEGVSLSDALRSPVFWAIAACGATCFYPIFATTQQFILYLQTPRIGISAESAALAQSLLFTVGIGGRSLAGYLSDKLGSAIVMACFAGLMFAASLVLLDLNAGNALIFLLPFALGYGGTFVLLQRTTVDTFGRRSAAKILGVLTMIEVIGAAFGGRVTGYLADRNSGDYQTAFYGVTAASACAFAAAVVVFLLLNSKRPSTSESH